MYCLMIDRGAPPQETAKYEGGHRCPRMRARTQTPVYQCGDGQGGRVGDQQMDVVGLAVEFHQFGVELGAHRAHGVLAEGEHLPGPESPPTACVGAARKLRTGSLPVGHGPGGPVVAPLAMALAEVEAVAVHFPALRCKAAGCAR